MRGMTEADLPGVLAVETACFTSPWTTGMFRAELLYPLSWQRVAVDEQEEVIAFIVARHYGDVWHVMDLAVAPLHHKSGLGGRLLDEFLVRTPVDMPVVLEVCEGNPEAIALYRSRGFRDSGRRPRYYPETGEAALLMVFGPEVAW